MAMKSVTMKPYTAQNLYYLEMLEGLSVIYSYQNLSSLYWTEKLCKQKNDGNFLCRIQVCLFSHQNTFYFFVLKCSRISFFVTK